MTVAEMGLMEVEMRIEELRTEMFNVAATKGFVHRDTVKISQELDGYINRAHELRGR